jgi:hypothetical protein
MARFSELAVTGTSQGSFVPFASPGPRIIRTIRGIHWPPAVVAYRDNYKVARIIRTIRIMGAERRSTGIWRILRIVRRGCKAVGRRSIYCSKHLVSSGSQYSHCSHNGAREALERHLANTANYAKGLPIARALRAYCWRFQASSQAK